MALITKADIVRKLKNDLGLPGFNIINEAAKTLVPVFVANPLVNPIPIGLARFDPGQTAVVTQQAGGAVAAATWVTLTSYTIPSGKVFYLTGATAYSQGTAQAGIISAVLTSDAAGQNISASAISDVALSAAAGTTYAFRADFPTPIRIANGTVYLRMYLTAGSADNNAHIIGWIEDA